VRAASAAKPSSLKFNLSSCGRMMTLFVHANAIAIRWTEFVYEQPRRLALALSMHTLLVLGLVGAIVATLG
jgi:hypothetical protein